VTTAQYHRGMRNVVAIASMLALTIGCGCKRRSTPDPALGPGPAIADGGVRDAPVTFDAAAIDGGAPSSPRPASATTTAALTEFVDTWLATQNHGDFAAYQALYQDRFHGVRRSGSTTKRFDRAGWMSDRAGMFRRPMTVHVTDLVVYDAGPGQQVFFIQTWQQGSFKDVGTKNLVVVDDAGQRRIVYEEMLGSRIVAPPLVTAVGATATSGETWFGLTRTATLSTASVAVLADNVAAIAVTHRGLPPIDLTVVDTVNDAAAGGIGAVRVTGRLAPDDPLQQLAGQSVVVLDGELREVCRGRLTTLGVEVAAYIDLASDEPAAAAAGWARGNYVITAGVDAPCQGGFVRGVEAAPLEAVVGGGISDRVAAKTVRTLAVDEADSSLLASFDDGHSGFALFAVERGDSCEAPQVHERVLFSTTKIGTRWQLTEVARIDGVTAGLTVADLDGDGALDAILSGGVYRAGRFDLWNPDLMIPWPAGLGCDGTDD
jgi:hypothetical protein